jgi:hypothetical protein
MNHTEAMEINPINPVPPAYFPAVTSNNPTSLFTWILVLITNANYKCFGIVDVGHRLEGNTSVGRKGRVLSFVIPTIHETSFCDLSIDISTTLCRPKFLEATAISSPCSTIHYLFLYHVYYLKYNWNYNNIYLHVRSELLYSVCPCHAMHC